MWGKTTPHVPLYLVVEGTNTSNAVEAQSIEGTYTRRHMKATAPSAGDQHEPGQYEIRLKGHLDDKWADWFEGLTITRADNGETLLRGSVVDQAALHGVLRKVRDLGLPLLSVMLIDPKQANVSDVNTDHNH
jgi:hypothetical protein